MKGSKNIYVLTCKEGAGEFVVGVFSSLPKVKECVRVLSKKRQYKTYSFPLNKKIVKRTGKLTDRMERYLCHYFGTFEEDYIEVDKNDKIKKEGTKKILFWPD
jgi:hypothetical protein